MLIQRIGNVRLRRRRALTQLRLGSFRRLHRLLSEMLNNGLLQFQPRIIAAISRPHPDHDMVGIVPIRIAPCGHQKEVPCDE